MSKKPSNIETEGEPRFREPSLPFAELPDAEVRRKISQDLDRTIFVEAGAGSGKTRSLVERMIALLRAGKCAVGEIAAVTFTRKATAELRSRFQIELEKALGKETDAKVKERLRDALRNLEQCAVGTIHSFCARLLRERPIEIGLDPGFTEMEEIDDAILRAECWADYLVRVRVEGQDVLRGLEEAGVDPEDLEDAFDAVSLYPEVEIAGGRGDIPDYAEFRRALEGFLEQARKALPREKPEKGYDALQKLTRRCLRRQRNLGFDDHRVLMETFELLEKDTGVTQNRWPSKDAALAFKESFDGFRQEVVAPALRAWREYRHERIIRFLKPAVGFFEARRREENKLNFGDLLMLAARLLRENPEVRRYFSRRYTHVLVDEFQDTDPIQAEVLMYLKGEDDQERDWQKLKPRTGSLFLVGDPRQSIYRFRRADIDTYNWVKKIVEGGGGDVLRLTANHRSLPALARWNNPIWKAIFPERATRYQAAFAPIVPVREEGKEFPGAVYKIVVPKVKHNKGEEIASADAETIADWISRAIPPARPSDFLILFRYKKNMSLYARALERRGIPFEITGSDAFSDAEEVFEITNLALALSDPDNPVYTVAVLRGLFCGASDEDLVEFKREGGRFNYLSPGLEFVESRHLGATNVLLGLQRLRTWRDWTLRLPASAALHQIFEDSGIVSYLVSKEMGSSRAGNILKLLEIVRNEEKKGETSFSRVVKLLEELAGEREIEEISLTPARENAVRLMNLHKAKGLEAKIVFLANPSPSREHEIDRHIVRVGTPAVRKEIPRKAEDFIESADGRPRGYFAFYKRGKYRSQGYLLSYPVSWEKAAEEERKYREAEEQRLMYVAATRARDMLVVSTYEGEAKNKPWKTLDAALRNVPELEVLSDEKRHPGAAPMPALAKRGQSEDFSSLQTGAGREGQKREKISVSKTELEKARKKIRETLEDAARPSYQVETVTSLAKKEREAAGRKRDPGLGLSWGRLVHQILEAIGSRRLPEETEKIELLIENLLAAEEDDYSSKERLVAHVMSILKTEFWQRISRAEKRFFEIPFTIRTSRRELAELEDRNNDAAEAPEAGGPGDCPVLLSGTIDLVFWEDGRAAREGKGAVKGEDAPEAGWVIVDYKTDAVRPRLIEEDLDELVQIYSPQIRLYGRFWSRITGEPVKEAGLYFTSVSRWVAVGIPEDSPVQNRRA